MSACCRVCLVFPPRVSLCSLFPRSSPLCAPWQKTRTNSNWRPLTSFCFPFLKVFCFVPVGSVCPVDPVNTSQPGVPCHVPWVMVFKLCPQEHFNPPSSKEPPAMASKAPSSALTSICLFRSGGPRPVSCPCGSLGASRVPPLPGGTVMARVAPSGGGGGELCQPSVLCSRLGCP